jgi:hypothetical protein
MQELEALLAGIASTEFADNALQQILRSDRRVEGWRVGEAIAEAYLVGHRNCHFPWPGGRDLKNPESSPAGTDLLGFHDLDGVSAKFSFAEVKTSGQNQYPPSLVFGRNGLKQQLKRLRDSAELKDALVRYLGLHAMGRPWLDMYRRAASRYLHDRSDVTIFGVFVRDVAPSDSDCSGRASELAQQCPSTTMIELLALYFPAGSIATLAERMTSVEGGQ